MISADALANLNTKDPRVVTTGPASINPDTGKPYGMSFPIVSYRDTVRVHKALVDSLGVKKLHAVAGASGFFALASSSCFWMRSGWNVRARAAMVKASLSLLRSTMLPRIAFSTSVTFS